MIDELLGRAELKARIEELEAENDRLESQLEAESDRRADAVRDRQQAQERANRLEDRITELEDRVDRLQSRDDVALEFHSRIDLRGDRLRAVLSLLRSVETAPESALTAVVDDESDLPRAVVDAFGSRVPLVRRALPGIVYTDEHAIVSVVLRPPIAPEPTVRWDDRFDVEDEWFRPAGRFAFGVVRSDVFALGVYEGDERVSFEGFESEVKSDHSKGGFSQGRFERRRDEQIAAHLGRVEDALDAIGPIDRTILVGERTVLDDLETVADVTATVDARGEPKAALEDAFDDFWTSRLYVI